MMFIFSSYFTPGVNFFIVLQAAFIRADSESAKKTDKSSLSFWTFEICPHKSWIQNVGEIEPI